MELLSGSAVVEIGAVFFSGGTLVFLQIVTPIAHIIGIVFSFDAIMRGRTSQGAVAWAISLLLFPYLAVPIYLVFGNRKFEGYIKARRSDNRQLHHIVQQLDKNLEAYKITYDSDAEVMRVFELLARMTVTNANDAKLQINGEDAFDAIFEEIRNARVYILVQFFIIRDDETGNRLKELLLEKAGEGVKIYVLFDMIGSHRLSSRYLDALRDGGIQVVGFKTVRGMAFRFQLNFRNHRKLVLVDGRTAFVGGLNVGDEYLGPARGKPHWRDTQVQVSGPAVQCLQLTFLEDWYWATKTLPDLNWTPQAPQTNQDMQQSQRVLVIPSSPADPVETCGLFFVHAIHSAKKRVWIVSPYFVPDQQVVTALQLAGLRHLDVRLMIPQQTDHLLVHLSSFTYLNETQQAGVKIYRYQPGFLHQKVMLIDDAFATVGTANLDNRSFRINFEMTLLFSSTPMIRDVEAMLEADFKQCREVTAADYQQRPFWFRLAARTARLMAPIQ